MFEIIHFNVFRVIENMCGSFKRYFVFSFVKRILFLIPLKFHL